MFKISGRFWFTLTVLCGLLLQPAIAGAQPASPMAEASPVANGVTTPVDCATLGVNEVVAARATCVYVTVPESRASGSDTTIKLAVVQVHADTATTEPPIVVGTGGPGGYGLSLVTAPVAALDVTQIFAPVLANHDMIFFTQRGTQGAVPQLRCTEFEPVETGYDAALEGWTRAEFDAQIEAGITACRDEFLAQGVDLAAYNSVESAADVNDIRSALGYSTIIYYGQSYGTQLGQFVMRDFPEILDAVVLDGVVPAAVESYAGMFSYPDVFQRVFDACAADPGCAAAYPDLEQTFTHLVESFATEPKEIQTTLADGTTATIKIDDVALINFISGTIRSGYTSAATVPNLIYLLATDPTPYLPQMVPSAAIGSVTSFVTYLVDCSDDRVSSMDEFGLDSMPETYQNYTYADGIKFVTACNVLDLPQLPTSSDAPVTNDIPVLVMNGGLDPATAPENGAMVAEFLPESQNVIFPQGGHIQWRYPCGSTVFAAFIADPTAPVDNTCSSLPMVFDAPFTATVDNTDETASISVDLPAGFHEQAPGQWGNTTGLAVAIAVLPAGTDADTAITSTIEGLTPVDPAQITDGQAIVGQPSRTLSVDADIQGTPVALDIWAVESEAATYVVFIIGQPPTGSLLRAQYPAFLESVTFTP